MHRCIPFLKPLRVGRNVGGVIRRELLDHAVTAAAVIRWTLRTEDGVIRASHQDEAEREECHADKGDKCASGRRKHGVVAECSLFRLILDKQVYRPMQALKAFPCEENRKRVARYIILNTSSPNRFPPSLWLPACVPKGFRSPVRHGPGRWAR